MRLWHKDLIPVLPRKQLLAQWRECCAIASNIAKNGTPNHILVNKVLDYSSLHFKSYCVLILKEMHNRGYKVNEKSYQNLIENIKKGDKYFEQYPCIIIAHNVYPEWHNTRYLIQCFCNLQEKYDCGMFTDDEWLKVNDFYFSNKIQNRIGGKEDEDE